MQVYSATTNQVKKSISRFHQNAYSGRFRHDGQLLAAGSEEGVVKVGMVWEFFPQVLLYSQCARCSTFRVELSLDNAKVIPSELLS